MLHLACLYFNSGPYTISVVQLSQDFFPQSITEEKVQSCGCWSMEDSKQYNTKKLHLSIGQESSFIQKLSKSLLGKSIFVLTQNSQKDGIIGVGAKQYMPFCTSPILHCDLKECRSRVMDGFTNASISLTGTIFQAPTEPIKICFLSAKMGKWQTPYAHTNPFQCMLS